MGLQSERTPEAVLHGLHLGVENRAGAMDEPFACQSADLVAQHGALDPKPTLQGDETGREWGCYASLG